MLPLSLLLLISSPVAILAVHPKIDCSEEAEPSANLLASDCHALLARLPSLPLPIPAMPQPRPPSVSPSSQTPFNVIHRSSPFLPRADLTHGTCEIGVIYYDDAASTWRDQYAYWKEGDPPAMEGTVLWAWSVARATALAIVDRCVERGQVKGGHAYRSIEMVPELEDAAFDVYVRPVPPQSLETRENHGAAMRLLREEVGDGHGPIERYEDPFQEALYIV